MLLIDLFILFIFAAIVTGVIASYSHRILRHFRVLYLVKTPAGCLLVGQSRFNRLSKADQVQDHWLI